MTLHAAMPDPKPSEHRSDICPLVSRDRRSMGKGAVERMRERRADARAGQGGSSTACETLLRASGYGCAGCWPMRASPTSFPRKRPARLLAEEYMEMSCCREITSEKLIRFVDERRTELAEGRRAIPWISDRFSRRTGDCVDTVRPGGAGCVSQRRLLTDHIPRKVDWTCSSPATGGRSR